VRDAEQLEHLAEFRILGLPGASDVAGDGDIIRGAEGRKQIVLLKDEADEAPPHRGAGGVGDFREILAIDDDLAGGCRRESAEDVK
jgi:hypothetical protein